MALVPALQRGSVEVGGLGKDVILIKLIEQTTRVLFLLPDDLLHGGLLTIVEGFEGVVGLAFLVVETADLQLLCLVVIYCVQ